MIVGNIREMLYSEIGDARDLVRENWGYVAADRARLQMIESFKGGRYAPKFFVANVLSPPYPMAGFCAYCPSMLMHGAYDLIWIAIAKDCQSMGLGKLMTNYRIAEIEKLGGTIVSLMTQKPMYFVKFGFEALTVYDGWWLMSRKLDKVEI